MITTKNGSRFYTAAEKYAILEELEKWMETTGSHNVLRFAKERDYPLAGIYEWRKFKAAGVPLTDSQPRLLVPGDPRIDAGHAQAARNRAIKKGAVNPARQHTKPYHNAEEAHEAKKARDMDYYYKRRAQEIADKQTEAKPRIREGYPDETTRTYWSQVLFRARTLGREEVVRVHNNFRTQTGCQDAAMSRWAREYSRSPEGRQFLVELYSGKAPIPVPPPKPVEKRDTETIKQTIAAMGQSIEPAGNGRTNPDLSTGINFRLQTLSTEIEVLKEEIHQNTAKMAKVLSTLAEIETYFR